MDEGPVRVIVSPAHTLEGFAEAVAVGKALTVIVEVLNAVHPAVLVPVTV